MEKVILTQLSTDDLKDIIYDVMTKVIEEKKLLMLPDEKKLQKNFTSRYRLFMPG